MTKQKGADFSKFLGETAQTRKELLIEKCKKLDVSIYIDDEGESSSGIYGQLRAVASEAELEKRLNSKEAVRTASCAFKLAILAFLVSFAAFVRPFF